jgi:hypothetical protein
MPDFTLRSPDGDDAVTGDPAERALLLARGYTDVTDQPDDTAEPDDAAGQKTAKTKPPRESSPAPTPAPTSALSPAPGVEVRQPDSGGK